MEWKTAITNIANGREFVRGYDLGELIAHLSFVEAVFLILRGEMPNAQEARMMNALFTAAIDHGVGVSSAMTARTVASTGNSMHTAIAAGVLAMGTLHGSAIEGAARFFQEHAGVKDAAALVARERAAGRRIPGYGHKILSHDPRTDALLSVAQEAGFHGLYCVFAARILEALNRDRARPLPLNVDGAMAAIALDMGFDARITQGLFIIGRIPGLAAHVFEEMTQANGLRRLREEEAVYEGPAHRTIA